IRTLVSLPHLFPEHFQTGILKSHSLGGALLFGPPGTGKTLVAQAVAKESGVRMLVFKPTDIVDKCDGQSEKIVASLFKLARRLKPCLIFMDEINGLLGTRIYHQGNNSGHWDTRILTQFMQEMDGLISSDVLVIGTTNRPFDLDEAIVRRLPHRIMIDLPKRRARREIMRILLRDEVLAPDVNLRDIARETKRFSGSDLRGLCVSAALAAAKENLI
ncbi:P-loop containing nucleoside triphosphate hydrolase protein, partial [Rhizoctonia solani]